jgi:lysozyme family protein
MTDLFSVWSSFALFCEGGLTNDPHDPGGLTNFGIDQRDHPDIDIRHLTRDAAIEIYRTQYWVKSKSDQITSSISIQYADAAINMGIHEAAILLQEALDINADGDVGPVTIAAANKHASVETLIEFAARRADRYAKTDGVERFGLGWFRRTMNALRISIDVMDGKE